MKNKHKFVLMIQLLLFVLGYIVCYYCRISTKNEFYRYFLNNSRETLYHINK